MTICDSCGTIGGGHTPFCRYQNRDPEMLEIHESHRILEKSGRCMHCDRGDVPGLVLECAKNPKPADVTPTPAKEAEETPIFPIDSSHETEYLDDRWRCKFCGGFTERMLQKPCTKEPEEFNFAAVEIHPSHRVSPKRDEPIVCENCGASNSLELTRDCINASPARRVGGPRRRFDPDRLYNKGVLLSNETVWAIYYWEQSPMVLSIHARPEQAINANTDRNSIFPWKLGTDFGEAVRAWESRDTAEEKKE